MKKILIIALAFVLGAGIATVNAQASKEYKKQTARLPKSWPRSKPKC